MTAERGGSKEDKVEVMWKSESKRRRGLGEGGKTYREKGKLWKEGGKISAESSEKSLIIT